MPVADSSVVVAQIKRVADRLSQRKIRLEVTEDAVEFLASRGYDPAFGARPVKRVVQQMLETAIAKVRSVANTRFLHVCALQACCRLAELCTVQCKPKFSVDMVY